MKNFVDFHSYHLSCGTCRVQKSCSLPMQIKSRLQGIKNWRDNLTCRLKYRISCIETLCLVWEKELANGILSQRINKSRINFFLTHGSVHRSSVLIKIQPDATVCRYLFTAKSLYMFRVSQQPSSGVLKTVTAASGTGTSLQRGRSGHVGGK